MVPDTAIVTDAARRVLYVVDKTNTVTVRPVQLGPLNGNLRVIRSGVGPQDQVIIGGIQRAMPGQKVKPKKGRIAAPTTSEPDVPGNIITAINHPERIFPIGRLDKDSSGLILLTNDGDIVNEILRVEHGHEREYVVRVDRPFDREFLDRMAAGVLVLGRPTLPCRVRRETADRFRIVLIEGRNRQIRRMCQALGYRVMALQRVRIMHLTLDGLPVGRWQDLTAAERDELFRAVGRAVPPVERTRT